MPNNKSEGRVHFSDLAQMRLSPAHYKYSVSTQKEATRAMTVGALTDAMVLGGRKWIEYEGKVRNGKEWQAFASENSAAIIGIRSEVIEALDAANAVNSDPTAQSLLRTPGMSFQTCHQWSAFGLDCECGVVGERGGIDAFSAESKVLVDLKVTATAEPWALSRHAYDRMWHAQLAWYLEAVGGDDTWQCFLICVENTQPHCVTCLCVPSPILTDGRKSITLWAEKLRACHESGRWPGYTDAPVEMVRPAWIQELEEGELS